MASQSIVPAFVSSSCSSLAGTHETKHEAFGLHLWYRFDAAPGEPVSVPGHAANASGAAGAGSSRAKQGAHAAAPLEARARTRRRPSPGAKVETQTETQAETETATDAEPAAAGERAGRVAALAFALRHHPALAGLVELVEEEARAVHGGSPAPSAPPSASATAPTSVSGSFSRGAAGPLNADARQAGLRVAESAAADASVSAAATQTSSYASASAPNDPL
jgi:hypothetical protein